MCASTVRWKAGVVQLGSAAPHAFTRTPDVVDERGPRPHQRVAAAQHLEVRLRRGTAVPDGKEELRVESPEPGEVLGIGTVVLALAARDQLYLPRVGDDDVVPELREHPAQPRGPRPHLQHHPRARHPGERPRERRGRGADSLLPDDLPVVPEDAEVAVAVAHVDTDGHEPRVPHLPALCDCCTLCHGRSPTSQRLV